MLHCPFNFKRGAILMPKKDEDNFDLFAGYKHETYNHFRMIDRGKKEIVIRKGKEVVRTVLERVNVDFEDIKKIDLDNVGVVMPSPSKGYYTQIQNYFIDFWSGILGPGASMAYMKLQRHCYGSKNFCFKDIEIMSSQLGMSRKTFNAHLEKLEKYGFVIRFWREDNEDDCRETSPLFIVRETVPMVPQEIIDNEFSKELIMEHDKEIARLRAMTIATGKDSVDHVAEIISKGVLIEEKPKTTSKTYEQVHEKVCSQLNDKQLEINDNIHSNIIKYISKPSYETFLSKAIFLYDEATRILNVLCYGDYSYDYVSSSERYHTVITEVMNKDLYIDTLITFKTIEKYLEEA